MPLPPGSDEDDEVDDDWEPHLESPPDHEYFSTSTIVSLCSMSPGRPLFPQLRELHWRPWFPADIDHFRMLASPNISPNLNTITFHFDYMYLYQHDPHGAMTDALPWLDLQLQNPLEKIDFSFRKLDEIPEDRTLTKVIRFMLKHKQLRSLRLAVGLENKDPGRSNLPYKLALALTAFLPDLRAIELGVISVASAKDAKGLITTLVKYSPLLRKVALHINLADGYIEKEHLQPLKRLHHLQHLEITAPRFRSLESEDVRSLGEAWPNLVHLELGDGNRFGRRKADQKEDNAEGEGEDCTSEKTSITLLPLFAECFPRLSTLGLHWKVEDNVDEALGPDIEAVATFYHWFKTLKIGAESDDITSPGERLTAVCRLMSRVLPSSSEVYSKEGWATLINEGIAQARKNVTH